MARIGVSPFPLLGQHDPGEELYDRDFVENWVNWEEWLQADHPDEERSFERFIELLKAEYSQYTPEFAAKECRIPVEQVIEVGEIVANAGSRLATTSGERLR